MGFGGFSREGLGFLTELGSRDKSWMDRHRDTYEAEVARPAKEFVVALADALRPEFGDGLVAQPRVNGSIAPINNDLRFRPDGPAYKDHLMFRFWEGPDKSAAAMLMIRLGESDTGFATGISFGSVQRWREAVAAPEGEQLDLALRSLAKGRNLEVVGEELKRVPAPHEADHPRADLLRHKYLQARWLEPTPRSVGSAHFVDWCARRMVACRDVHEWLVAKLT